jgi:hypothetical protein
MAIGTMGAGTDDDKMNRKMISLLANNKKDTGGEGKPNKDIPNLRPPTAGVTADGPMHGPLMNYTQMLESLDLILENLENSDPDMMETPIEDTAPPPTDVGSGGSGDDDLLNELNEIFTPILVMQGIEGDISDQIQEAFSESSVLLERNIIKFDDSSRMAQLISVCALLIQRHRNSPKYQMFKKAMDILNSTKLEMQKEVYGAAQALAQKYLVKVSTTNNSSVARNSASRLLPETQH